MTLKALIGAVAAGLALASSAHGATVAWVEETGQGATLRVVTEAPRCPTARVGGALVATIQRAAPDAAFPNRVCEAAVGPGGQDVLVEGRMAHGPQLRPQRIVVLGDSGCRLKGLAFQRCNDPAGWPFARIATLAAARKPDLVIHIGDYYYRERACPDGNAGCAGSPYGDRWATWKAELFDPAAPLLAAAPWVFARGNHETCDRGGAGWFRLLDAASPARTCPGDSATFAVDLGGQALFVVDSSDTDDLIAMPDGVRKFAALLAPVKPPRGDAPAWIVTHRPFWNSARLADLVGDGFVNATERAAVRGRDIPGVGLILSGHVHNFTSVSFGAPRPAQLVVGTGGDTLDLDDAPPPTSGAASVDGLPADIFTMARWGYFVFDRRGRDWDGRFYDTRDRVTATCHLRARNLKCRAVGS